MAEKFYFCSIVLTVICIVVYILELLSPAFMLNNFALVPSQVITKPWTMITHIFLHSTRGLQHIFYNMFALVLFGSILEKIIGSRKFLSVFFVSGVASAFGGILFYDATIGASGAIFGVLGTLGILRPKMLVWVLGVPVPLIIALGMWAFLDLIGFFAPDNVAHAAHLFGMMAGIACGLRLRNKHKEKTKLKEIVVDEGEIDKWEENSIKGLNRDIIY
ncbi:MAG: rhomboid family intramembrane serine protease [Candidatus Aenigmarchaeota archaeon]|nr:rhomboid family intramembrane serine protease [Candidatus Aenigmarchaeota archaeon]